jgi:YidC/Oxa1 family membrane protein insertase
VLFYWTTSNLWTMGQQFYVIRRHPAPGTPAFEAKQKRDRAKGRVVDEPPSSGPVATKEKEPPRQRQQPKRQSKSQRKKKPGGGAKPPGAARGEEDEGTSEGKSA